MPYRVSNFSFHYWLQVLTGAIRDKRIISAVTIMICLPYFIGTKEDQCPDREERNPFVYTMQ
ncbi:hypothetical protein Geob_0656 [Geotalea daltonii FRC-32]|uniref:Uncharacterized protein n=1 Tax=Geotalea daltonii (strain DSM 22248 / JCM 15807 / FRC-32) TaxID=316067 RepID=B9M0I4_GEODF|nr:hypothetical protein [Geotalea daltonii]ACM19021.1 hypothetical protein Geob_0656 [Geotalea daltonii FRC-32]